MFLMTKYLFLLFWLCWMLVLIYLLWSNKVRIQKSNTKPQSVNRKNLSNKMLLSACPGYAAVLTGLGRILVYLFGVFYYRFMWIDYFSNYRKCVEQENIYFCWKGKTTGQNHCCAGQPRRKSLGRQEHKQHWSHLGTFSFSSQEGELVA